jgi:hypothetical protein
MSSTQTDPSGTQTNKTSGNSGIAGIICSICCCICSFVCFVVIIRGLMPQKTQTIVQVPYGQPIQGNK